MDSKTINAMNEVYQNLSDELDIPETLFKKAEASYSALGEYLSNNLSDYDIDVFPQGSMKLGTTIKPISEDDDYDLDAVCKLRGNISGPEQLKNIVGDILKDSDRYSKMLNDEEGKRCWTIKYSDEARFHMDILPATLADLNTTELKITNKENGIYEYKSSNPEAYAKWFFDKQKLEREKLLEAAKQHYASVEDLPHHGVRTTLQRAIQILKRHRNFMFIDDTTDSKPISIIITTLVAQVYTGKENIYELIQKFINEHTNHIKKDLNGNYIIENPINPKENFADKWITNPERKDAFFKWMNDLKASLLVNNVLLENQSNDKVSVLKKRFGEETINKVFAKQALNVREGRSNGTLFTSSVSGITTLNSNNSGLPVKEHTFYGE